MKANAKSDAPTSARRYGSGHPRTRHDFTLVLQARDLRAHGWSWRRIGLELGVHPETVRDWTENKTRRIG